MFSVFFGFLGFKKFIHVESFSSIIGIFHTIKMFHSSKVIYFHFHFHFHPSFNFKSL
jgi:hypothetical protein